MKKCIKIQAKAIFYKKIKKNLKKLIQTLDIIQKNDYNSLINLFL